jgi:NADPH2:quinone reductase
MRALVVERPGPPTTMRLTSVADPDLRAGEVLVSIEAVGVNPVDASNRADPAWAQLTPPYIVGYEFSGTIVASGDRVWGVLPVRGTRFGAYAELVAVDASYVAPRPEELTSIEAAALPLVGLTSLQILDRLALSAGDWLVVHGAAGGVGSVLVQLARARGLRVAALAGSGRHALLRDLGTEVVVDRDADGALELALAEIGTQPRGVVDLVGQELLNETLPHIAHGGAAAAIVELAGDFEEAIDRNITIHGLLVQPNKDDLDRLAEEVRAGRLRPVVDEVFALEDAVRAHERVESGHGQGRVVLSIAGRSI